MLNWHFSLNGRSRRQNLVLHIDLDGHEVSRIVYKVRTLDLLTKLN